MIFRIAKKTDGKTLAKIHLKCGKIQPDGFMHKLGLCFLRTYYSILLNERSSIIVLAEDENGVVWGFHSGTLLAQEHLVALNKNRIKLALSSIPALIHSPGIFLDLVKREKFVNSQEDSTIFGVTKGPRGEYWAWLPESKNPSMAISLLETWLNILFELGCNTIKAEVDISNTNVLKIHKLMGAKIVETLNLSDGRQRIIIEYNNQKQRKIY